MHLLGALQSGFADAPAGFARIYRRGTTTNAPVYSDFEGRNPVTDHTLDARGRVRRYVNELVDVKVFDVAGNQVVETFTEGVNATAVEIIHPHVTGTDYTDGSSGLNKPSTGQLVLDKLYATFGGDDFKLTATGSGVSAMFVKDAVGPVFNVMSSSYGALGNGVNNDTTAIQSATTDAGLHGGGTIFFPPGNYRLTSALALGAGTGTIRFAASGDGAVTLTQATAGARIIDFSDTGSFQFSCHGLRFVGSTGGMLQSIAGGGTGYFDFSNCRFTGGATAGSEILLKTRARFNHCEFECTATTGVIIDHQPPSAVSAGLTIVGGRITWSVNANVFKNTGAVPIEVIGVDIVRDATGAANSLLAAGTTLINFVGCHIRTLTPAVTTTVTGSTVREAGCTIGSSVAPATTVPYAASSFRDHASLRTSTAGANYTPDSTLYMVHEVVCSNAAFQWLNPIGPPAAAGLAHMLILRYKNTNGAGVTPTFDTAYKGSAVLVASGSGCGWLFVYDTTLAAWTQIGSPVAYAS